MYKQHLYIRYKALILIQTLKYIYAYITEVRYIFNLSAEYD